MVLFSADQSDDPAFLDLAGRAVHGGAALASSEFLHLVKIDSWFGDKWFRFAGKLGGAVGVHHRDFIVPPFHPHRVAAETRVRLKDQTLVPLTRRIHTSRTSASNLRNAVARLGESITVAWYSGSSSATGRGSVMAYSSTPHGPTGWYAGLERRDEWTLVKLVGSDHRQWDAMLNGLQGVR